MSAIARLAGITLAAMLAACQTPRRASPPEPEPILLARPTEHVPPTASPPVPSKSRPALHTPAVVAPIRSGAEWVRRWRAQLATTPCVQDRVVQRWEQTYARWPERFSDQVEAVLPLMALALEALEAYALPGEFALLPIVESWYRADAGRAGATLGMWQFGAPTARSQGIAIVGGYDGRMAPAESTRAAMRYLAELMNRFADWRLASMAYNAGEYRLAGVLARSASPDVSPAAHRPAGLSPVTYEHLAKLHALACLFAEPQRFGVALPLATRFEPLHPVTRVGDEASIHEIGRRAGITSEQVRALNPAFLGGHIVAGAGREVLLPESAAKRYGAARPAANAARPAASPQAPEHVVRSGETLGSIARRHRLRLVDLLRWNDLEPTDVIHPGQRLRLAP